MAFQPARSKWYGGRLSASTQLKAGGEFPHHLSRLLSEFRQYFTLVTGRRAGFRDGSGLIPIDKTIGFRLTVGNVCPWTGSAGAHLASPPRQPP